MKDITLVIPAKNEPNALPLVLEELRHLKINLNIIIILDKEDLGTIEAAKKFDCEILFQTKKGYGNAIIEGLENSKTTYSCIYYADGSTDPKYILEMFDKLKKNNLDIIFGSRYEKNAYSLDDDLVTRIGNFFFTFLGNFLMRLNISDLLFTYIFGKTEKFKQMKLYSNDYCLCVEIPFKCKKLNFKYTTHPCIERKRFADKKKVKAFSDGLKILIYLLKKVFKSYQSKKES